ncbi:MAG: hypothetical protein F4057_02065 [Acidobacteria bacterium]|nr:hypothetical protein [Acidobacteriota bacterium]MYI74140.1 hypothetical protein [Acidobacteriota bacterium]
MSVGQWLFLIAALVGLVFLGLLAYALLLGNPRVVREIQNDPQGQRAGIVMLLGLPNGRTLPVNYLREGDQVFVGADGPWWRAVRDGNAPVTVTIRGETLTGRARVVFDDPDYKRSVFERLRPDVPGWLPAWMDAHLVVIDLDE